jgi:hypothetical protein
MLQRMNEKLTLRGEYSHLALLSTDIIMSRENCQPLDMKGRIRGNLA